MTEQLPEPVRGLLEPQAYPEAPPAVHLAQTQMSFIFFAGDYVYKVKKSVNLGYLDYTSLEKRRFFCEQEVKLNRRLCPDTYLGVVPVVSKGGRVVVEGDGSAVEYAVKMRRLPPERMMNVLLERDQVSADMVAGVAEKLSVFHRQAETNDAISAFGDLEAITTNTDENFSQTEKNIGKTISPARFRRIKDYTNRFVSQHAGLFRERVAGGRIRDCHGDLHAAHICFTDGICIYDCIEFNERFRYCDVASEIAFLAMDLDHYGRADLSRTFVRAYVTASGDKELTALFDFYKCYRAYVRGKVEGFKLDDPYIPEADKRSIAGIAGGYFDLADFYARARPVLLITVGLVGTGKSTIARGLARRLGLTVISSDVIRKQIAGVPATERHFDEFSHGLYSPEFTRLTYDKMFSEAESVLREGGPVMLDASFIKAAERSKAKELAEHVGADLFVVECVLDEVSVKERLARRVEAGSVSDGRWAIYGSQKKRFDPVVEEPGVNHVVVDTAAPVDEVVTRVIDVLQGDD